MSHQSGAARVRTREDAATRRAALDAAASAIVREEGFGAATVKTVTARAGMSAGLLYRYENGLDALLAGVFRRLAGHELAVVERAVRDASPNAAARLTALVDAFARRALRGRRLAWALLAEPVGREIGEARLAYRAGYAHLLTGVIEAGVAAGELPPQDPRITAAGLVGAIGEALTGPLSPLGADSDPDAVVGRIRSLCLRAAGAAPAGEERIG